MTTSRLAYRIDAANPGSDLAAETAAALASASMVFHQSDPAYSNELLEHAKQVILAELFLFFVRNTSHNLYLTCHRESGFPSFFFFFSKLVSFSYYKMLR